MAIPEESVGLDPRVDEVYQFGVPLVLQPSANVNQLDDLLRRSEGGGGSHRTIQERYPVPPPLPDAATVALARRVVLLLRALREDEYPSSVLHALFVRDWQDVGSIAAVTDCDLATAESELELLVDSGIVETRLVDGFREYRIAWALLSG